MKNWPSKIALRFLEQGKPIDQLLVFLLVKAPTKNGFPLGFFLTDSDGVICLTRKGIVGELDKAKKDSPMDYEGTLGDCDGLEIVIDSSEALRTRIQNLKWFYPANAEKIEKFSEQACNKRFANLKIFEHTPLKNKIDVELNVKSQIVIVRDYQIDVG